ncbi:MAG: hypothetical protein IT486_06555 [Gammaproteobacteria bacterium]|nr:hypothetical protein [Gammaproteobacteria bacterium]
MTKQRVMAAIAVLFGLVTIAAGSRVRLLLYLGLRSLARRHASCRTGTGAGVTVSGTGAGVTVSVTL